MALTRPIAETAISPIAANALSLPTPPIPRTGRRNWVWLALALVLMAGIGTVVYQRSIQRGMAVLKEASNTRLDLFASVVEARVRRLEPIPATIQLHPAVVRLLRDGRGASAAAANDYLARLNAHLGSEAVFALDVRGVVLASSNTSVPDDSLVGNEVSYRPYFLEALSGRSTRQFAIGSAGQAGYFAAHPIYDGQHVVGVAAIKIGLGALEQTWDMLGVPALVVDANQVVILSSHVPWHYTAMGELSAERRVDLQLSRIYGAMRLAPFPLNVQLSVDEDSQEMHGLLQSGAPASVDSGLPASAAGYMVLGRSLDGMDWRVLTFTNLTPVRQQALLETLGAMLLVAVMMLMVLYWAQRQRIERQKLSAKRLLEQANAELEQEVHRRTLELTQTNNALRKEVAEREHTEKTLRAAQDELVHAGKMAVLGQLAASITHELTQPLGGIRTLAGNAAEFLRRGNHEAAEQNLAHVDRLVGQMAGIIDPLKSFARKSAVVAQATDVGRIVSQALFLYQLRLRHENVEVDNRCPVGRWWAWCDPNRLEQVLINLIGNALDAMRDAPNKRLTLTIDRLHTDTAEFVRIHVQDSGKGLSPEDLEHLFQPFYTTKPSGAGLGLGLVICRDIATEFGGELHADPAAQEGACFTLTIPLDTSISHSDVA